MKNNNIPSSIKFADKKIKVIQKKLGGKLGCLDINCNTIFIEKDQMEIGKMVILIHELIHLADLLNVESKIYKKGLTETQVESIAGILTILLISNNIISGFSNKDIISFLTYYKELR